MINLDELTVGQLKEIRGPRKKYFPRKVGDKIFIRTVTHYYLGEIEAINGDWITLKEASWIADTGRFHDFLKEGKCNEYEAFIDSVDIPMGSIIDVTRWNFPLFKGQK